jgi:hypothetical protein
VTVRDRRLLDRAPRLRRAQRDPQRRPEIPCAAPARSRMRYSASHSAGSSSAILAVPTLLDSPPLLDRQHAVGCASPIVRSPIVTARSGPDA